MRQLDLGGRLSSFTNRCLPVAGAAAAALAIPLGGRADSIGVDQLHALDPSLNGMGVRVAQVESGGTNRVPSFEVNPNNSFVNQTAPGFFTYYSTNGTTSTFNDGVVGLESGHANTVAAFFYGTTLGVATNVSHVDNYDTGFLLTSSGTLRSNLTIPAAVINQSFAFGDASGPLQIPATDASYDNYVALNPSKVFVTAAGNSAKPGSPATAYNGITAGATGPGAQTATGPTADGRSKPDIVAPAGETSNAAPQVSGAAAILVQAGARGDGGAATAAGSQDFRVIKALLLNGATKPSDWAHTATTPLDPRYGAGVLNIFNSYVELAAGKHSFVANTANTINGAHPPLASTSAKEPSNAGWDFATLTSPTLADSVNHYAFTVTTPSAFTATLDWERQNNESTINNLDLYLYNAVTGAPVDSSVSTIDNVEHLYDPNLPAGQYDLEVLKHGASTVSAAELYGLAYNFAATPEPGSALLLAGGAGSLFVRRRRLRTPGA